jgi:hypothetical protein
MTDAMGFMSAEKIVAKRCKLILSRCGHFRPGDFLGSRNGVDLGATNDASGDRKLGSDAHEIGIDLTGCLAAFIDAPEDMLVEF